MILYDIQTSNEIVNKEDIIGGWIHKRSDMMGDIIKFAVSVAPFAGKTKIKKKLKT